LHENVVVKALSSLELVSSFFDEVSLHFFTGISKHLDSWNGINSFFVFDLIWQELPLLQGKIGYLCFFFNLLMNKLLVSEHFALFLELNLPHAY